MRGAVAGLASILVACAGASSEAPLVSAPGAASAHPSPAPVTVDALLARTAGEGSVLLRLSVAREHPLGSRLEPYVLAWPGWGPTLASLTKHPVAELDWIDVVGPKDAAQERLATRTAIADEVVDARLAARSDGTLRAVIRPRPHVVVAVTPDSAPAVEQTLRAAPLLDPAADPDEAVHVDFLNPHEALPNVPAEARRLVLRVYSRPGGGAEAFAELTCDDEPAAAHMADWIRGRVDSLNNLVVRVLTRELLNGLVVDTKGPVVELRLPATREQLESLATLAAGFLPPGSPG
jgi:hypothetical protein